MKNLRRMRVEKGLSQEELAARVGTSQSAIHECESGEMGKGTIELLINLSNCLDVSVDYLIGHTAIRDSMTAEDHQLAYQINHLRSPELTEKLRGLLDEIDVLLQGK